MSVVALLLSKTDKPSFMPSNNSFEVFADASLIGFSWINTSQKNICNLTILINQFDGNLIEVKPNKIEDRYNFTIAQSGSFNYSLKHSENAVFYRVRFKGKYNSAIPFIRRNFNQVIWYSAYPLISGNSIVGVRIHTTFKEDIRTIENGNKNIFEEYEKTIDKKLA